MYTKNMNNIEEFLRVNEYTLYLVSRKHWFVRFPDSLFEPHVCIDVGQYDVEELFCQSKEDYKQCISNFSHLLEDDENAILTYDNALAYYHCCKLNQKLNDEILEQFNLISQNENVDLFADKEFQQIAIREALDCIERRKYKE